MSETAGLRVPPQAVEIERHVIGAMLLDSQALAVVIESLTPDDFYVDRHRWIYEAAATLFDKNMPADSITVADAMRKAGTFDRAGGDAALLEISGEVVSSANAAEHCRIVKEKAMMRRLIDTATKILERAYDKGQEPMTIMDQAEGDIFAISTANIKEGFRPIKSILSDTFKLIDSYSKGEIVGVPSGFKKLDEFTAGFQKTDLIVLGGRPGMGKTSLALNILTSAAIDHRKTVAFFSLEMGREQLVQRVLCAQAKINMHLLRSGRLPKTDYPKLSIAVGPISESKIFIDDHPSLNILELRAKCRRLKAQQGLDLVMVDYLQLMSGVGRQEGRQYEIAQISRGLKSLAKELEIPVIALAQVSRDVEKGVGRDGDPRLSDLRDSGAIEQDADLVMFIVREDVYNKEVEKGKAKIMLSKQRNGPTGVIPVTWIEDYASFINAAHVPEMAGF